MPPHEMAAFQTAARTEYDRLAGCDADDAVEFAVAVSALLHECRHVHDLRATRCGAELLLHDLQVYAGATGLLEDLRQWHRAAPGRHLPFPVAAGLDQLGDAGEDTVIRIQRAERLRNRVERWWNAPSRGPFLPGHSLRALYESLGFAVQVDWLAATFGDDVANLIVDPVRANASGNNYLRPAMQMASLMTMRGATPGPQDHALSWLLVSALSVSGLDEAFDTAGVPTASHPGTWFQKFADRYARLCAQPPVQPELLPQCAVEMVLEQHGIDGPAARYQQSDAAIQALQDRTLTSFAEGGIPGLRRHMASLLIATEVGIDFRDMQRAIAAQPQYHLAPGYVSLLAGGGLTTVHVRVRNPDGTLGDFRTPSHTPSNHVGAARHASEASQQMRLLLRGRSLSDNFFEEAVYQRMKAPAPDGLGLSFLAVR